MNFLPFIQIWPQNVYFQSMTVFNCIMHAQEELREEKVTPKVICVFTLWTQELLPYKMLKVHILKHLFSAAANSLVPTKSEIIVSARVGLWPFSSLWVSSRFSLSVIFFRFLFTWEILSYENGIQWLDCAYLKEKQFFLMSFLWSWLDVEQIKLR